MRDITDEAIEYLKREVPKLDRFQYRDLDMMVKNTPQLIDLAMAESMIYTVTHQDEVEQLMFGPRL